MPGTIDVAAVKVVHRHLGARLAGRRFLHLRRREKEGEPFGHLPAARTLGETRSRQLAGAAIRLFRELTETVEVDDPLALTTEAVEAGMVVFLNRTVGAIRRRDWVEIDDETRAEWLAERASGFPGIQIRWDGVEVDELRFTVTGCRIAQLCAAAGESLLARLFCKADARFLGQIESQVVLIRDATIAAGHGECPFRLRFRPVE